MLARRKYNGINITRHAQERARERFNMKSDDLCVAASESLEIGIDVLGDPTLRGMIIQKAIELDASGIYAHKGMLFIFKNDSLVTVYPLNWIAIPNYGLVA